MLHLARASIVLIALAAPLGLRAYAESPTVPAAASEQVPAQVLSFEGEEALKALAAKGTTVVFFYANWCPNCRATVTELNERWDEVRPGLNLVIADYDKEQALKAKYGVTYQDTFVLLDKDANAVQVWNSGGVDGLNAHTGA